MEEVKSGDKQGASGDDLPSIQKESSSKDVKRKRNRASPKGRKQTHIEYNKKRKVKLAQKLENQKEKVRAMVTVAAERAYEFGYQAGMIDRNVFKNDQNVEKRMKEVVPGIVISLLGDAVDNKT